MQIVHSGLMRFPSWCGYTTLDLLESQIRWASAEERKILGNLWASDATADREDPEDVGITRTDGWPIAYEQIGSGKEPERSVFNQKFREWTGFGNDVLRMGILQWDSGVDYNIYAFVTASDGFIYVANVASGPGTGDAIDPITSGQTDVASILKMENAHAYRF